MGARMKIERCIECAHNTPTRTKANTSVLACACLSVNTTTKRWILRLLPEIGVYTKVTSADKKVFEASTSKKAVRTYPSLDRGPRNLPVLFLLPASAGERPVSLPTSQQEQTASVANCQQQKKGNCKAV